MKIHCVETCLFLAYLVPKSSALSLALQNDLRYPLPSMDLQVSLPHLAKESTPIRERHQHTTQITDNPL